MVINLGLKFEWYQKPKEVFDIGVAVCVVGIVLAIIAILLRENPPLISTLAIGFICAGIGAMSTLKFK